MPKKLFPHSCRAIALGLLTLIAFVVPSFGQQKILGGYFEEWSIYYAGYNIANLQQNGVANKLSHLLYAFANVTTTPAPGCAIADSWADYQTPYLPSVNGQPYPGPLYGNFAAIQQLKGLHPKLKVLMSIGGASSSNTQAFQTAASTAAGRQALAASCIDLFINGNIAQGISAPGLFDGFNIDWEFPTASDTQNFTALLTEFRNQLNALGKTTGQKYVLFVRWTSGPAELCEHRPEARGKTGGLYHDRWIQLRRLLADADQRRFSVVRLETGSALRTASGHRRHRECVHGGWSSSAEVHYGIAALWCGLDWRAQR